LKPSNTYPDHQYFANYKVNPDMPEFDNIDIIAFNTVNREIFVALKLSEDAFQHYLAGLGIS
jgi:hypothetical protein